MANIGKGKEVDESFKFDVTSQVSFDGAPAPESKNPPIWVWFSVAGLLIIALLVIFVLPTIVNKYQLPLEPRISPPQLQQTGGVGSATPDISPFEQAQRSRQRKEAQDILAEVLRLQSDLEQLNVQAWASAPFEAALESAGFGDEYYREQNFLNAAESYSEGFTELQAILESSGAVFQDSLRQAEVAFERKDAATAIEKFTLAGLLEPSSEEAQIGLERSLVLDQVLSLLGQAEEMVEGAELEEAQRVYEEIVSLDSFNGEAQQGILDVSQLILEAEFSQVMSKGYDLLQSGDPEQAILQFENASGLGVNADQAVAAIKQTENEIANSKIAAIQNLILSAEDMEQWHDAVTHYDRVLEIDSNIVFAVEGKDYASKRAQLNDLLEQAIAGPDRFYEEDVFQQTLDIYYTGREVEKERGGPVLLGQLDQLAQLLETSQIPIQIQFTSDNLTDVSILRVTNLGLFEQTSMALKPGRYVALGRRIGYRETRTEFVVGFGQTPEKVSVRCTERLVPTNR